MDDVTRRLDALQHNPVAKFTAMMNFAQALEAARRALARAKGKRRVSYQFAWVLEGYSVEVVLDDPAAQLLAIQAVCGRYEVDSSVAHLVSADIEPRTRRQLIAAVKGLARRAFKEDDFFARLFDGFWVVAGSNWCVELFPQGKELTEATARVAAELATFLPGDGRATVRSEDGLIALTISPGEIPTAIAGRYQAAVRELGLRRALFGTRQAIVRELFSLAVVIIGCQQGRPAPPELTFERGTLSFTKGRLTASHRSSPRRHLARAQAAFLQDALRLAWTLLRWQPGEEAPAGVSFSRGTLSFERDRLSVSYPASGGR
jgi:hypothetical protein